MRQALHEAARREHEAIAEQLAMQQTHKRARVLAVVVLVTVAAIAVLWPFILGALSHATR